MNIVLLTFMGMLLFIVIGFVFFCMFYWLFYNYSDSIEKFLEPLTHKLNNLFERILHDK